MLRQWIEANATCVVCDLPCAGSALCAECCTTLPRLACPCPRCALPRASAHTACGHCLLSAPEWDDASCAFAYRFPVNELLRAGKFRRDMVSLDALAQATAHALRPAKWAVADCIVPVPLHWRRHWQRGFNQSLELARPLARRLGMALSPDVLRRCRSTPAQSARDAADRRNNLERAFVASESIAGQSVVLFDDVLTTGATLNAATVALRQAGAAHVRVVTCARAE